jgi:DNA-binding MarR family transcriptional regulator
MGTTPQAASLLIAGMERQDLVRREPHPTHGRILEVYPTAEGTRRLRAARPFIRRLEDDLIKGLTKSESATVKRWLVDAARAAASHDT